MHLLGHHCQPDGTFVVRSEERNVIVTPWQPPAAPPAANPWKDENRDQDDVLYDLLGGVDDQQENDIFGDIEPAHDADLHGDELGLEEVSESEHEHDSGSEGDEDLGEPPVEDGLGGGGGLVAL